MPLVRLINRQNASHSAGKLLSPCFLSVSPFAVISKDHTVPSAIPGLGYFSFHSSRFTFCRPSRSLSKLALSSIFSLFLCNFFEAAFSTLPGQLSRGKINGDIVTSPEISANISPDPRDLPVSLTYSSSALFTDSQCLIPPSGSLPSSLSFYCQSKMDRKRTHIPMSALQTGIRPGHGCGRAR